MTLKFKIKLHGISKPPVWRRVTIPEHYTFFQFHKVIQTLFEWDDTSPFFFLCDDCDMPIYIVDDCCGLPAGQTEGFNMLFNPYDTLVGDLAEEMFESKFQYIYSADAKWVHDIVLEDVAAEYRIKAVCTGFKGASLTERCPGLAAAAEFRDHDMPLGAEHFDLDDANTRLLRLDC